MTAAARLCGAVLLAPFAVLAPLPAQAPPEPQRLLTPLLGEWAIPADDTALQRRPDLRDLVAQAYVPAVRGRMVRIYENYRAGRRDSTFLEGFALFDPVDRVVRFSATARPGHVFTGEYAATPAGLLQRAYDVRYPEGVEWIPERQLPGWVRRFRETYRFATADSVIVALDIWKDGRWQAWGPGEYTMVRRR